MPKGFQSLLFEAQIIASFSFLVIFLFVDFDIEVRKRFYLHLRFKFVTVQNILENVRHPSVK